MNQVSGRSIELQELRLERQAQRERGEPKPEGFVLGPLDLSFAASSKTAVVGPSGCGKTTLLRILAGFERATEGRVRFGDELVQDGGSHFVPSERRGIGFVFQDAALWPHLDAEAHLRFVAPGSTRAGRLEWLERVGLSDRRSARPAELSGGEKQRLALARALIPNPGLLFLDEPLASVDLHLRDELALCLRDLATESGATVVHVTHDREEALAVADDIVVLEAGQIVEQGSAPAVLADPKTGYAASFLGGAVLFQIEAEGPGQVRSPFGVHAFGGTVDGHRLAVLPGDLRPGARGARAELVARRSDAFGRTLIVCRIGDHAISVLCESEAPAGDEVTLQLEGPARILPVGTRVPPSRIRPSRVNGESR